jgi:hypothetical protein
MMGVVTVVRLLSRIFILGLVTPVHDSLYALRTCHVPQAPLDCQRALGTKCKCWERHINAKSALNVTDVEQLHSTPPVS